MRIDVTSIYTRRDLNIRMQLYCVLLDLYVTQLFHNRRIMDHNEEKKGEKAGRDDVRSVYLYCVYLFIAVFISISDAGCSSRMKNSFVRR